MSTHIETEKYHGADRREGVTSEMYNNVCKDRFASTNEEIARIKDDTQYLRSKIDNGLSSLPSKMNWLQATFITLLIAIIGGVGVWTYRLGQLEGELDNHIQATEKIMDNMLFEMKRIDVVKPDKIIIEGIE